MFKNDIKRAFTSIGFFTIITVTFIAVTYEIFDSMFHAVIVMKSPWAKMGMDSITAFRYLRDFSLIAFFFPLLCVLPYGTSISDEASSGSIRMILYRTGRQKYLHTRLITTAISGGSACAVTVALITLFTLIIFPTSYNDTQNTVNALRYTSVMFSNLDTYTAITFFLYTSWQILMSLIGGFVWSVVSLGISVWFPNRYFAMAAPVIVYCAFIMLAVIANGKAEFIFPLLLFGDFKSIGSLRNQILFRVGWLTLGCISYYFGGRRLMKSV